MATKKTKKKKVRVSTIYCVNREVGDCSFVLSCYTDKASAKKRVALAEDDSYFITSKRLSARRA